MKDERLQEFMSKVDIKNKDISEYTNKERGISYPINTISLLCRVDYLELTKEEINKAKFEQQIEKKDYKMYDCNKHVSKYTVTKKDDDKFTIIDKKVKATHIYNVTNALGIVNTYEDKEEAFNIANDINKRIYEVIS